MASHQGNIRLCAAPHTPEDPRSSRSHCTLLEAESAISLARRHLLHSSHRDGYVAAHMEQRLRRLESESERIFTEEFQPLLNSGGARTGKGGAGGKQRGNNSQRKMRTRSRKRNRRRV